MLREKVKSKLQNKLLEFKEPEDLNLQLLFKEKPKEFLKYLRKKYKNIMTSDRWDALEKESYDKGFTVSKVANADLLEDILAYVIQGRESGATFQDFVKEIDADKLVERMQEAGWTGKSPSRLKVIYETNIQVAYSKEKFKQQSAVADVLPLLGYEQIERSTKRHDHTKYHRKAFPASDPIWKKIYPPSGFGCKCMTISLDIDDAKELGFDIVNAKDYTPEAPQLSLIEQWQPDMKKYNKKLGDLLSKEIGNG